MVRYRSDQNATYVFLVNYICISSNTSLVTLKIISSGIFKIMMTLIVPIHLKLTIIFFHIIKQSFSNSRNVMIFLYITTVFVAFETTVSKPEIEAYC